MRCLDCNEIIYDSGFSILAHYRRYHPEIPPPLHTTAVLTAANEADVRRPVSNVSPMKRLRQMQSKRHRSGY